MTSFCFELLFIYIKGQYFKLEQTRARKIILIDKRSLNGPQVRLIKPKLHVALFFLYWEWEKNVIFNQKLHLDLCQQFGIQIGNRVVKMNRNFNRAKTRKFTLLPFFLFVKW